MDSMGQRGEKYMVLGGKNGGEDREELEGREWE